MAIVEARGAAEEPLDPKEEFLEFLRSFRDRTGAYKYRERVKSMISMGRYSLVVDFRDLYTFNATLARMLVNEPDRVLRSFSEALREFVEHEDPEYAEQVEKFVVRISNLLRTTSLRSIRSTMIGKLVMLEGILVRATPVKEKMVRMRLRHVHPECGEEFDWPLEGELGPLDELEKPKVCPVCGKSGGSFKIIYEKSRMIDWQKIVLQERPEEVPPGQLPRSIEVVLTDELVDAARPGDRIVVVGVVRVRPDTTLGKKRGIFDLYIEANNIEVSQKVLEEVTITREDEERIRALARDPWVRKKIVTSIAPTIYGMWDIKEAIALALFGGVPKQHRDGTRRRGDIHVLMIGDPGTAKSQLLQYVVKIAPRAIYTTGKGATAAGLTAAVIRDKTTGEYYLEAGALVLADGGVAAIDEIDKMREEDRSAIHEAMEQQTVSIAKAGIVARLNARTTVIAAGNPRFGRYLPDRPLAENINLPPPILSRFDLIFVIRDIPDPDRDRALARFVLQVHSDAESIKPEIPPDLLRKYISYARRYVKPKLTEEAMKLLEDFFTEMRKAAGGPNSAIPLTARQLEALIRLAEAHAKMKLKDRVTREDAEAAIRLVLSFLSSAGIDVESGSIDIDTIMTGKPKSKRDKMIRVMNIMKELLESTGEKCVPFKEIVKRAAQEGIDSTIVEETIRNLSRDGIIYEVQTGCYAFT